MVEIINGVVSQEHPNGTGLVIVNGILSYWDEAGAAPTGAIMNQFMRASLGADLFNGVLQ